MKAGRSATPTSSVERRILEALEKLKKPQATNVRLRKAVGASPRDLEEALDALEERGEIVRGAKNRVSLPSQAGLIAGRVSLGRRGGGVILPDVPGPPLRLKRDNARPALDGDRVLATATPDTRHGLQQGRVASVTERMRTHVVGAASHRDPRVLEAQDSRLGQYLIALSDDSPEAVAGHTVCAEIVEYPTSWRDLIVRVVEDLGETGSLPTEIEGILRGAGIQREFPETVLEATRSQAAATDEELATRTDLRDLVTFTIDPADAKDHDDAVSVAVTPNGWRLVVSIADVAHYVPAGGVLDAEAFERATSVYLPGTVVPMLPHELSNDLASLRPDVDRLVVSALIDISNDGDVTATDFARSIIRSRARVSYEEAQATLDGDPPASMPSEVRDCIEPMRDCAASLLARRLARGSVDLNLPEAQVVVDDDGNATNIRRRDRIFAHRIVEEFMLAANEAVARFLEQRKAPFLYRIHERPSQKTFAELATRLEAIGLRIDRDGARLEPLVLRAPLAAAKGQPFERQANLMVLRSMTQARYSGVKEIHFGLASEAYCHFTSPIRRYPDLIVHRALLAELGFDTGLPLRDAALEEAAVHCSRRERRAMEAERDAVRVAAALLMRPYIGDVFEATVATVDRWGYGVELDDIFVEGSVHVGRYNEYLDYIPEHMELVSRTSSLSIRIGDHVSVRLDEVDLASRSIEFAPAPH
ncbi:MAG: ribonuclease R [Candidatus Binatia bacterium]